jgi:hypothetical protein
MNYAGKFSFCFTLWEWRKHKKITKISNFVIEDDITDYLYILRLIGFVKKWINNNT